MVTQVRKRDGKIENFDKTKIANAIYKAAIACDGNDKERAVFLADEVEKTLNNKYGSKMPTVEEIQDVVEKTLIENRHAKVAKAFILYREKHYRER